MDDQKRNRHLESCHLLEHFLGKNNSFSFVFVSVFQGQKGESGGSGKSTNGTMQFTNTADNCTLRISGTVRYNTSQKALELCDGSVWLALVTATTGYVAAWIF